MTHCEEGLLFDLLQVEREREKQGMFWKRKGNIGWEYREKKTCCLLFADFELVLHLLQRFMEASRGKLFLAIHFLSFFSICGKERILFFCHDHFPKFSVHGNRIISLCIYFVSSVKRSKKIFVIHENSQNFFPRIIFLFF